MQYIDQIILICVGLFIAFSPSTFVRGYDKKAQKAMTIVRIIGFGLVAFFVANIVYLHFIKK